MRIAMLVYNRCTTDPRVLKEAATLAAAGHDVRIVAILDATTTSAEERDGFRILRIDRNPLHYRLLGAVRRVLGAGSRRWGAGTATGPAAFLKPEAPGLRAPEPGTAGAAGGPPRPRRRGAAVRAAGAMGRFGYRRLRRALLVVHKPLMFLDWYLQAYRLVRRDPPDAVHAHDLNTLPAASALARRLRIPLVYDAHELYPEISTLSQREARIWALIERRLAPRADHVVTVCESIAGELTERYGVARPLVLLNCPTRTVAPPGAASPLRDYVGGLDPAEPIVLYQGGFAPHRGLPALVRAAHGLERGVIVLMGWGRLEEELRRLVAAEGLAERVRIVDPVAPSAVLAHAAGADVGVIPYEPVGLNNTYTTPNKLFDYMSAGLPVAASRLPELCRFIEGGGLGVTFTPGDPVAIAEAMNEILSDPDRCAGMSDRARAAGERYTWERESNKLLALYA